MITPIYEYEEDIEIETNDPITFNPKDEEE